MPEALVPFMGGVTFIPFTRDPPAVRPKVDIKKPATDAAPAPGVCVRECVDVDAIAFVHCCKCCGTCIS